MSELERFKKKYISDGFEFTIEKTNFGSRSIGKKKGKSVGGLISLTSDKFIFIEYIKKDHISMDDLTSFVKTFEKHFNKFKDEADIEGGYFLIDGQYDKKSFQFFIDKLKKDIRNCIEIKSVGKKKAKEEEISTPKTSTKEELKESEIIEEKIVPKHIEKNEKDTAKQIVNLLDEWQPRKRYNDEKIYEEVLATFLEHHFPNLKTQQGLGSGTIDVVIGKVGIEIKRATGKSQIDRLDGQIRGYLDYLDHIVVIILQEGVKRQDIDSFKSKLDLSRVSVIVK